MPSQIAGDCDFGSGGGALGASDVVWTAAALPSVIALTESTPDLSPSKLHLPPPIEASHISSRHAESQIVCNGVECRVRFDGDLQKPLAAKLPLDRVFEVRTAAALRLWRALARQRPGSDPAALSILRRDRLALALRALDGHRAGAQYREIASIIFADDEHAGSAWRTLDVRDRTIRLVRYGTGLMKGGYRRLLLHPYRLH